MKLSSLVLIAALIMTSVNALASTPNFQNITEGDFTSIINDFSALASYTSVSGASGRGSVFGFEVGLIGSLTQTPNINSVVQKTDSSISIPQMPNAGLLGAISIPGGLGFEVVLLPKYTYNGVNLAQYGGAIQYKLLDFPISISLKAHYTKTAFDFTQNLNGGSATVKFDDSIYGADLMAGKDLIFLEPYVGLGYASANASLGVSGTASNIYSPSYTTSQTSSASPSSARVLVGVNFKLLLISLGAEYLRTFGTDRYSFKLSAGF